MYLSVEINFPVFYLECFSVRDYLVFFLKFHSITGNKQSALWMNFGKGKVVISSQFSFLIGKYYKWNSAARADHGRMRFQKLHLLLLLINDALLD